MPESKKLIFGIVIIGMLIFTGCGRTCDDWSKESIVLCSERNMTTLDSCPSFSSSYTHSCIDKDRELHYYWVDSE